MATVAVEKPAPRLLTFGKDGGLVHPWGTRRPAGAWNEHIWALVAVGGSSWQTIGPALHNLRAGSTPKYSIILTGSFIATIPLILLLFVAGRQIVRGIMDGAAKA